MLRMQVYIPENLYDNLKRKASVEDVSMSELIRQGLQKILRTEKRFADPMKVFVGQAKTKKRTNALKDIEDYYKNGIVK